MIERWRPVVRAIGRLTLLLAAALPWQSLFWIDTVPVATKAGFGVLVVLAAWRPRAALMVLAALVGIAAPLTQWTGIPAAHMAEAMALTFLSGWFARRLVLGERVAEPGDALAAPTALFAAVVVGSLVVMTAAIQPVVGQWWPFITSITGVLTTGYLRGETFETHNWYQAGLLLEGVALCAATRRLARQEPDYQLALIRMLAAGAVAGAGFSFVRLAQVLLRADHVVAVLVKVLTAVRLSEHMADFNAAGSHFVLVLPLTVALGWMAFKTGGSTRAAAGWTASAILLLLALWLTGSRAAQFSILLTSAIAAILALGRRRAVVVVATVGVVLAAIAFIIAARPRPESSVVATLQYRWLFTQMSWEMWKTAPAFGIGIAEYFGRSAALMPAPLRTLYVAENAHNNFLQIGVELGLAGLAAFLWLLGSAASGVVKRFKSGDRDPMLVGLALGVSSTILTFLTGHPLLVGSYAFCFWIALGLMVSVADGMSGKKTADEAAHASIASRRTWLVGAAIGVVLLSVPVRAHLARSQVDVSAVRYGFAAGGIDPATGDGFELAGPVATVFAERHAKRLSLTVGQMSAEHPVVLEVRIDGALANRVVLRDGAWQDVRMLLPVSRTDHAFRRIDLVVSSGGAAAEGNTAAEGTRCRIRWLQLE